MPDARAKTWLEAASDATIASALEAIYARAAAEVGRHGPVCRSSGRCCNFEKWGHRLYVTGLEVAYTLTRLGSTTVPGASSTPGAGLTPGTGETPGSARELDDVRGPVLRLSVLGPRGVGGSEATVAGASHGGPRRLALADIDAARGAGGCPFQAGTLCSVHAIKPLGCRVYFCDQSELPWQGELTETALAEIKALHEAHDIPYRYGEWRDMLEAVVVAVR